MGIIYHQNSGKALSSPDLRVSWLSEHDEADHTDDGQDDTEDENDEGGDCSVVDGDTVTGVNGVKEVPSGTQLPGVSSTQTLAHTRVPDVTLEQNRDQIITSFWLHSSP